MNAVNADKVRIGAVIVARMNSSRFPGKSMADIAGRPSLEWLISRAGKSRFVRKICIATTYDVSDQPIENLANQVGVQCIRGSENDVLGRVLEAARCTDLDIVIHLTGDCPLIDPDIIDDVVELFFREGADYAKNFQWGENADPALNFPNGLDVEVFRTKALAEVDRLTTDPWLREHVTEPLYTWPQFKAVTLRAPLELARPDIRMCLDTREDFELIKTIFENLCHTNEHFSAQDIIRFLDNHPDLLELNKDISQKKYTAAVIGLGLIGSLYDQDPKLKGINTHSGAYMRWSRTRLVGGCDPDERKREAFVEKWGVVNVFQNASDMLSELKPEIVSICTPPSSHSDLICLCIQHSVRAILCEKPFVYDAEEGENLVKLCKETNTILAVNHWMRYSDLYIGLRKYIQEGGMGRIWGGRYHYSKGAFNSGTHSVDILTYLLGDVASVRATERLDIGTGDDNIGGMLKFLNGAMIHLTIGDYRNHFTTELDLIGTEGRIRLTDNDRTVELFGVADSVHESNIRELYRIERIPFSLQRGDFMIHAVSNIIDALEGRAEVLCSGEDGLRAVKIIKKMHESLNNNGRSEELI